ncbi:MAG TPA: SprT family zinc-dependent metalloprotease [Burkholderiaceae bacterium]|nr:SprT family zinc-dependent metalloprotease [Burkholderiaceae bacterium]
MPTPARQRSPDSRARGSAQHPRQLSLFDHEIVVTARAPALNTRWIQLADLTLDYVLKRGKRRTIGFAIDDSGLTVTAPRWVTLSQIEEAIREKSRWIMAKLAEWRERRSRVPALVWADGAMIPMLGGHVRITLEPSARVASLDQDRLLLPLAHDASADQIRDRVQGFLQARAKTLFAERLAVYCERAALPVGRWRLSSARTRWGSCTSDGTIRLNWRLMHFPMSVIDYVVAHEVAHRRELNHGPRFWQAVESIFPEFRAAEDLLKFHAPSMMEQT